MIHNNLSVLLAERNIKITRVAKDTGISRSTITAIAQNDSKMIQMETIDTLCRYLNISPQDFFEFVPINIEINVFPKENNFILTYN
ncbi:XRE family transcriptional regulator, partial [Listeria monocytogenes]|nr:XRE family transcriptional regulator [Listeria monocytogenes]